VRRRATRPVERDLESVLGQLAEDFPLLAFLVERQVGGQRRLLLGRPGAEPGVGNLSAALSPVHGEAPLAEAGAEGRSGAPGADRPQPETSPPARNGGSGPPTAAPTSIPSSERGARQPAHYGLRLQFAQHPDDPELARLVESTVWINEAHPAYRRAAVSRSEGYHIAVAVALALAPLAVEPTKEHGFLTAFLSAWGAAMDRRKRRRG